MLNRLVLTFALAVSASACIIVDDGGGDASLTVRNDSSYYIYELYVAPVDTVTWGPNLLRGDFLAPAERITLDVRCDYYDARMIDDTGAECLVYDLDLCLNDSLWVISNSTCTFHAP